MQYLKNYFFYLVVFLIPFQARFFFASSESFYRGSFIEYNGYYITTVEFLIISSFLFFKSFWWGQIKSFILNYQKESVFLIGIPFVFLNVCFALSPTLAVHKALHLICWACFFYQCFIFINQKRLNKKTLIKCSLLAALLQVGIAFLQFIFQRSLNFFILGESYLAKDVLGVAKIDFLGTKIIRAYGTEPHPNILGYYLLANLFLCFYLLIRIKIKKSSLDWVFYFGPVFLIFGIFLSFSRSIIALTFISLVFYYFFYLKIRQQIFAFILFFLCIFTIFFQQINTRFKEDLFLNKSLASKQQEGLNSRLFYQEFGILVIKSNFFLGIGLGNFVFWEAQQNILKPWELQPVHNLFILLFAETGVVGLIYLVIIIVKLIRYFKKDTIFFIATTGITGLFDHYLISFSQGMAVIFLILIITIDKDNLIVPRGTKTRNPNCSTWNN